MTYRHDSDVYNGYGGIIPFSKKAKGISKENEKWLPFDPNNITSKFKLGSNLIDRGKDIVWMVSHCQTDSKREDVVKKLKVLSNLTIDIFGEYLVRSRYIFIYIKLLK